MNWLVRLLEKIFALLVSSTGKDAVSKQEKAEIKNEKERLIKDEKTNDMDNDDLANDNLDRLNRL